MNPNILQELEDLRLTAETRQSPTAGSSRGFRPGSSDGRPYSSSESAAGSYGVALHSAERSVDRLGRAIEAAEEEMELTLKKATQAYRLQLQQKERELQELQRVVAAKEQAIDMLRESLSAAKRKYEMHIFTTKTAAEGRNSEVVQLHGELALAGERLAAMQCELEAQSAVLAQQQQEADDRHAELKEKVKHKEGQLLQAAKDLRRVQHHGDQLQDRVATLMAQVLALKSGLQRSSDKEHALEEVVSSLRTQLRQEQDQRAEDRRARDADIGELRKRLKAERSLRKASEQWLKSELKTRDEMEAIFKALRGVAEGSTFPSQFEEVEKLITDMRRLPSASSGVRGCAASSSDRLLQALRSSTGKLSPGKHLASLHDDSCSDAWSL